MTIEQGKEVKRLIGISEELEQGLDSIESTLETEWQSMNEETQHDNQDVGRLIDTIHEFSYDIRTGYTDLFNCLEDVSGGLTE